MKAMWNPLSSKSWSTNGNELRNLARQTQALPGATLFGTRRPENAANYYEKELLLVDSGTDTNNTVMRERTMRYTTASFMLATDGTSSFYFIGCHDPVRQGCTSRINYYPEWDMKLGNPLGKYSEGANQIFSRDFSKGYVLVNPTTIARTVSLPQAMYDVNGVRRTSVTLQAHDGILLTK